MIARQQFYLAVRYDGTEANTQDLEIGTGNVANPTGLKTHRRSLATSHG